MDYPSALRIFVTLQRRILYGFETQFDDYMIFDNKQNDGSNPNIKTVWDCLFSYIDPSTGKIGRMDIVTGYFSNAALHIRTINNTFSYVKTYLFEAKIEVVHDNGIVGKEGGSIQLVDGILQCLRIFRLGL